MELIPAIDLLGGKVVRLSQGSYDRVTVYYDRPEEPLERFLGAGVHRVHVVDLDAARGQPTKENDDAICRLASLASETIQTGGGVRDWARADQLRQLGVNRVVVGTVAIRYPEEVCSWADRWPGGIVAALDAREGSLQVQGWQEAGANIDEVAKRYKDSSVAAILVTDIARDGMLTGPNLPLTEQVASVSGLPTLVSGGIARFEDLLHAENRQQKNGGQFAGIVIGRAYYENHITLKQIGSLQKEWDAHS